MNIIRITDINIPELKIYHELSEPQLFHYYEPEPGLFIAESPMIIKRALEAGYEPVSLLIEDRSDDFIRKTLLQSGLLPVLNDDRFTISGSLAITGKESSGTEYKCKYDEKYEGVMPAPDELVGKGIFTDGLKSDDTPSKDIPVYAAPADVLKQITGYELTRGILCAMRRHLMPDFKSLIKEVRRAVILENVMNPTNAGAIFRSAAALGMEAVLLTPGCTDPLYRRSARVSMGTVFQIPWTYLKEWPEDIGFLKSCGFKIAAMTLSGNCISLQDFTAAPGEKAALIMGTEGPGISEETAALCDLSVKIPMTNGVDSLNVAAASAVAFWQLNRDLIR